MKVTTRTETALEKYADTLCGADPEPMAWVRTESVVQMRYTDLMSDRVTGRLLAMLVSVSGAQRVLELGTFTGYSTLWMASALPANGEITTVDSNEKYLRLAREAFARSPWKARIQVEHSDALIWLERCASRFDIVFLDADKRRYPQYFQHIERILKPGGLLIADNLWWNGGVISDEKDAKSEALNVFNQMLSEHPAFEPVFLPYRDLLAVARKKS